MFPDALISKHTPHDFHCFNSRARKACRGAFNILHTRISFPLRFSAVQDSPGTLRLFSVNAVFLFRPIIAVNFTKHCCIMCLHKIAYTQGWYIGITAASQAVKAGSTPVPCSKKERHAQACLSFLESVGDEKAQGQVNCPCANAFAQQKHFTAQKRRASTRRSASRLDSNYLTAEVNSAYNNSPLRCELTRDFARRTRGTLKCSGEVNSPCANAFAQQKHFTAQKRRGERSG